MTDKQFKKYKELNDKIQPIMNFLCWVGGKYSDNSISNYEFEIHPNGFKKFALKLKRYFGSSLENTYEIPLELQKRIVKTIEQYVDEKQKELEEI